MDAAEQKRICTLEHPFGTVKRHLCGYYYLLKGKAEVEVVLLCMAYNMWWAINIVGVRQLVAALGRGIGRAHSE